MPYQPPIRVTSELVGKDNYTDICNFIKDKVAHLDRRLLSFRTEKLPEYVRLYKARPKNENVDWPWPGAANLVIPIIGTYSDELLARVMGGIWMYDPLWAATLSGDIETGEGEELKQIIQSFLMDMAYSKSELDLYRVSQSANHSAIKYGTGVVFTPHEYLRQVQYTYKDGGLTNDSPAVGAPEEFVKIDGPRPTLIPLNKWIFEPNVPRLEDMKMYGHIETLDMWQVKDLPSKSPYFKQEDIDFLLNMPDAAQETEMEREINEQFSIDNSGIDTGAARWHLYRLWFTFTIKGVEHCFQAYYHKRSERILWICFNNYPKNMIPYQDMKLAYDDESYLGYGFAEMLHIAQKEVSQNNNWKTNNRNYAMLGAWRIDPESKLSSMLDMYPGVAIPAKKDEVEYFKPGMDLGYSSEPDQFALACAKERVGVDPAMGGTGGGIVNPKRGIYSAAGTSMVMAQANNRNNLRTSDMRSAHVGLGEKFLTIYSHFGIGEKLRKYGNNADKLKKALDMYRDGSLGLRLRPASAAMNKELDRQNDILLADRIERFYAQEAQLVQAMNTPTLPEPLKKLYGEQLLGARALMQVLLRNFNKDNVDTILPDIRALLQPQGAPNGDQNSGRPNPVSQIPQGIVGAGRVPTGTQLPQ